MTGVVLKVKTSCAVLTGFFIGVVCTVGDWGLGFSAFLGLGVEVGVYAGAAGGVLAVKAVGVVWALGQG